MTSFDAAFERLIDHEGGLSLDANDPGNWTGARLGVGELKGSKFGISAAAYPRLDIRALTLDDARAIYRRDYWDRVRADELPLQLRFDLFDLAVNSGPGTAARLLQRAAGVAEDGRIGPATLAAVDRLPPHQLLARLSGHRLLLMTEASAWTSQGRGWARRVARNLIAA